MPELFVRTLAIASQVRYCQETGGEARHHHRQAMTATLIEKHNEQSYTLTTEKGREISVYFHSWGAVGVYIQRAGHPGLSAGRRFASVEAAIASLGK
ncbi:MAG: hypothetical protein EBT27_08610 [Betaproteobacteria bacterium]|nr:hypothetical protein [Betaproteobacteria bacterium]